MSDDPELRLRLAVLERALRDFQRHLSATDAHQQRLFHEAALWLASTDGGDPFAFERVCDTLGIDADAIRSKLGHWRAMQFVRDARRWLERRIPVQRFSLA